VYVFVALYVVVEAPAGCARTEESDGIATDTATKNDTIVLKILLIAITLSRDEDNRIRFIYRIGGVMSALSGS
jgi:hypothetical protein